MKSKYISTNTIAIFTVIMLAALMRLLPHLPNVTPIAAISLFGGGYFINRKLAFIVPLIAMFISDIILIHTQYVSFVHSTSDYFFSVSTLSVYISFALIVFVGFVLRNNKKPIPVLASATVSSLLFFIITNFAVWAGGLMYPHTLSGLFTCYEAALLFYHQQLLGDLFFTSLLFGGFYLAQLQFPVLAKTHANR